MDDHLSAASVHELRYGSPAREWNEALPLGNGTLGAMCFGGLTTARLQINDESAWSGSPASEEAEPRVSPTAARRALDESRRALTQGRFPDAEAAVKRLGVGRRVRVSGAIVIPYDYDVDDPNARERRHGQERLKYTLAVRRVR